MPCTIALAQHQFPFISTKSRACGPRGSIPILSPFFISPLWPRLGHFPTSPSSVTEMSNSRPRRTSATTTSGLPETYPALHQGISPTAGRRPHCVASSGSGSHDHNIHSMHTVHCTAARTCLLQHPPCNGKFLDGPRPSTGCSTPSNHDYLFFFYGSRSYLLALPVLKPPLLDRLAIHRPGSASSC